MTTRPPVLLIDDDEGITFSIATYLEAKGYPVTATNSGEEGIRLASKERFPLVLTDIYIDRITGLDILKSAKAARSDCAVILMTAKGSIRTTVEAEFGGAFDYLPKPIDLANLLKVLERAEKSLGSERPLPDSSAEGEIVGESPVMVELYKNIARAARSEATALIRGETGSGKELVARAIHGASSRSQQPFVSIDCAAIPENLWESELFGATKGAFTSAERDRAGIIEQGRGGTVFLDEIGEIPISFQAKLLRFLEAKEYRPVGGTTARKTTVRILAATHRPLEEMVELGEFRSDLYHRLSVLNIPVPALRYRVQDIRLLASRFLAEATQKQRKDVWLEAEAIEALELHAWPGNVRELKNAIERMVAMSSPGPLGEPEVRRALISKSPDTAKIKNPQTLEDAEKEHVLEALRLSGGNRTRAAERLGLQRRTLYKKLERWGVVHEGHTDVPESQKTESDEKD